ncbi:MAG: TetR/AcrR family transcriptional regulator [Rhodoblastus sp.]
MGVRRRHDLLDESVLDEFEAEGMRAAQQARSRALVLRLFNDGLRLLEETDFDGLSIEALCERSGSTVGAFYSRFESKEAYIVALQRLVVAQTRQAIMADYARNAAPCASVAHLAARIVKGVLVWYARYEGIVRASLRRSNGEREMWTPIRELGELQATMGLPQMFALLPPGAREGAQDRVRFAFQILFGVVNNMVLINPGPFGIKDPETRPMLTSALISFIEGPGDEISARGKR